MNDDYEELPAFEKNDFKEGDIVIWFGSTITDHAPTPLRGIIKDSHENLCHVLLDESAQIIAHFKTLRKLIKKEPPKPREFWITEDKKIIQAAYMPLGTSYYWFKVQDRCHKCGEDFNK